MPVGASSTKGQDMDTQLPSDPSRDKEKEPKNASIDIKTLLKGDLAGLLTGAVYSVSTLAFDRTGKSAGALCFFTVISIGITRIGSSLVDLYKKALNAASGTHYEALLIERRHHLECREANTKIYAEMASMKTDYKDEIGQLRGEFDAYRSRHDHEYETIRLERDNYKAGYHEMVSDLRNSRGNQPRNPDSDPKASVYDAGQGGNTDRGGQR